MWWETMHHSLWNVSRNESVKFTEFSWKKALTKTKWLNSNDPIVSSLCEGLPQVLNPKFHGFHWQCYQMFTFLPISIEKQAKSQATQVLPKRKKRVSTNVLLPNDSCIFSLKNIKYGYRKENN